jgi:hypothetical protein
MSADSKMDKTTTKSITPINGVLRRIQFTKGSDDGHKTNSPVDQNHNGIGTDSLEGTSGTTISAIATMTMQNADLFRMKLAIFWHYLIYIIENLGN